MKTKYVYLLACSIILFSQCQPKQEKVATTSVNNNSPGEFYQLKIYTFDSLSQQLQTDAFLKDAFVPAVKRAGITSVGVFKSRLTETDSVLKTYLLLPFSDWNNVQNLEGNLQQDSLYLMDGNSYINTAHDQPTYQRIESILLRSFELFPKLKPTTVEGVRSERIYELRSYESPTEAYYQRKLAMFNEGGEIALFDRLNFNAVFYGDVISGPAMPNLMYMTSFPNQVVRDSLWVEFVNSPEWIGMKDLPPYLNTVSKMDIAFLYPTDYSDY